MDTAQSDLVEWYKLETEFFQDHVRHTRYVKEKNTHKKVKEDWSNCGELGTGGFGVVYKQVLGTTGRYRAVKTIDKKRLPPKLDYYRELLIMAILAKVCVHVSAPVYYPSGISSPYLTTSYFSIRYCSWSSWDGSINPKLSILQWNISRKAISQSTSVHRYHKRPFKPLQSRYSRVSK